MRRLALAVVLACAPAAQAWDAGTMEQHGSNQNQAASATAANAQVVIAAATNQFARLESVSATCNSGTASLTVFNGATPIWFDIVGTTGLRLLWPTPLKGSVNTAMTITVTTCGAGNLGTLNVQGDRY